MMELRPRRRRPYVPMSSMSDIGFLLLIFIMLVSLINQRREVKIEYPEALRLEKTQEKENLEIWVEADGRVTVDGESMDSAALERLVAGAVALTPSVRVHILADRRTPYRHVNAVVAMLQTLQHRVVSFVAKEAL